jgi:hypothetical protein
VLSISIARSEAHVIRRFQERMPYGLYVPDVGINKGGRSHVLTRAAFTAW